MLTEIDTQIVDQLRTIPWQKRANEDRLLIPTLVLQFAILHYASKCLGPLEIHTGSNTRTAFFNTSTCAPMGVVAAEPNHAALPEATSRTSTRSALGEPRLP